MKLKNIIPVLIIVSIIVFLLIHLVPGDPICVMLGNLATKQMIETVRHSLNLDAPLVQQYFTWLGKVVRMDLGVSLLNRQPIIDLIKFRITKTMLLATMSTVLAVFVALATARRRGW